MRGQGRCWTVATVLILAAPLPLTAGGILLAERGPTVLTVTVLAVAGATGAACLAGVVIAMGLAAAAADREQPPPFGPDKSPTGL